MIPIAQVLLDLEESLLRPETRRSVEWVDALLADDFFEFGSSGTVYGNRQALIEMTAAGPAPGAEIVDFKVLMLGDGAALATYRLSTAGAIHSLRSSVWKFGGDRWRLHFHQGTPAGDR